MAKRLVVLIASLMVVVFIAGCPAIESEPEPIADFRLTIDDLKSEIENQKSEIEFVEPEPIADFRLPIDDLKSKIENQKSEIEFVEPEPITDFRLTIDDLKSEIENQKSEIEFVEPESNDVEPARVEPNNIELSDLKLKPIVSFHDKCTEVLKNNVDDKGMVDYKTLRRKRLQLKALLREFDNLDPNEYRTWPKEDKIAFWLNAYNIQMLKIITDNYPIKSSRILRLYPGWGPNSILHIKGIWTNYKFLVMDEEFTLSEIDRRFFRKEFDDPRIFFAISRASLSGPPLRNGPYYGYKLNEQLDDQARRFLSGPLAFRTDREKQRVYLSSLFQSSSYGKEFISKFAIDKKFKDQEPAIRAVLNFITNYVPGYKVSFLEVGKYSVKFMKYDWTINDGS